MAEIRKHKPHSTAIGDQVRAAIGGIPRPRRPDEDSRDDPFYAEDAHSPAGSAGQAAALPAAGQLGGFTLRVSERSGLVSLGADQLREMAAVVRDGEDEEDELGEDDDLPELPVD